MGKKKSEKQTFPTLSDGELNTNLAEFGVDDFRAPADLANPAKVRALMQFLVENVFNITTEDLLQPNFHLLEQLEYPQIHEEALVELMFVRSCQKLMQLAYIPNFSINDVHKPDASRLRFILSGLMNFIKYREDCLAQYQTYDAQVAEAQETLDRLTEEAAEVDRQLAEKRAQAEQSQPERQALEAEKAELERKIPAQHKESEAARVERDAARNTLRELEQQIESVKASLAISEQDIINLKSLVVSSPERLKNDLRSKEHRVQMERSETLERESAVHALNQRADSLRKHQKELAKASETLEECGKELDAWKQAKADTKTAAAEVAATVKRTEELRAREQQLRGQATQLRQRVHEQKMQQTERLAEADGSLAAKRDEQTTLRREQMQATKAIDANRARIAAIKAEMENMRSAHNQQMASMQQSANELVGALHGYHMHIFAAIANTQ